MMSNEVVLAIVAILGTCVGGLIWVIKKMFNEIVPILRDLTKATAANTEATKHADEYLRERNGRDQRMHTELVERMEFIKEAVVPAARGVKAAVDKLEQVQG